MVDKDTEFFENTDNFAKTANIPSIQIITSNLNFKPKVSIVIPTYKRAVLLKETIDSAINQNGYENYDIIVVDNDPERGCETEKLMLSYNEPRLKYFKNAENIGMFGNWNRCIELAEGGWITMLHDDDLLVPTYLKDIYEVIGDNSKIGFISCRLQLLFQEKKKIGFLQEAQRKIRWGLDKLLPKTKKIKEVDYLFGFKTYLVGSCFKKKLALQLGGFDANFFPSTDYYFVVNFQKRFDNVYFLKKKNYLYRIFDNESLKKETGRKFLVNDYYFLSNLIETKKRNFPKLLNFLNKQYVIQRLKGQKKIYNLDIEIEPLLEELDIKKYHNYFFFRLIGGFSLKMINAYRTVLKF